VHQGYARSITLTITARTSSTLTATTSRPSVTERHSNRLSVISSRLRSRGACGLPCGSGGQLACSLEPPTSSEWRILVTPVVTESPFILPARFRFELNPTARDAELIRI
jgi:hypothetical protein